MQKTVANGAVRYGVEVRYMYIKVCRLKILMSVVVQ